MPLVRLADGREFWANPEERIDRDAQNNLWIAGHIVVDNVQGEIQIVADPQPQEQVPAIQPAGVFWRVEPAIPIRPWRAVVDEVERRPEKPKMKNGPELWDKILYAVREVYEPNYACIAGGAVRDYLLGKPSKDIDVFVA